ncbi:Rad4 family protein [Aspergillus undulatus]|uniref:Rad4 family protein n=1 Tax=Aspergillus undulatus TaxID=1810928 RepID=UPI003CCDC33E
MPPFIPSKRQSSEDPPAKRHACAAAATPTSASLTLPTPGSDSSLTPVPTDLENGISDEDKKAQSDSDDADSDEIDWEDAVPTPSAAAPATSFLSPHENLELTLDRNEVHLEDILQGQKAPSKIERQIRTLIHRLHVQCLLAHNAIRNDWINDSKCHDILREKLPPAIQKEVQKWRRASGLKPPESPKEPPQKKKGKQSKRQAKQRDWGEESSRQEPGQPDLSNGDPIILLMRILAAYWKSKFKVTAPGLRKHGYRPMSQLQTQIASFHQDKHDPALYGERIASIEEFRQAAERMEGSRDVGAQLFTALLRALSIEARLVSSLQPLGFGWTKAESYTPSKPKSKPEEMAKTEEDVDDLSDSGDDEEDEEEAQPRSRGRKSTQRPGIGLPFPVYWAEVASPITHQIVSVDPLVLPNAVAATQELQAAWEPRGAKADKAKQVICYVVAFSADKTAKEVTTRYLRRRTWPGKTKGFRLGKKGPGDDPKDWFRSLLRVYERPYKDRTAVDDIEDAKDLVPNRPSKPKETRETVDTLQSLRTSTEFVLERFLRREEALRPGAQPVRTFTPGGKSKAKSKNSGTSTLTETPKAENVYHRSDIVKCQSAESWHKEGREPKPFETPLKRVPIRAVTLLRKREIDSQARLTGQKPLQGLYSLEQTQEIIPPPIVDGIIPKNDYGNIDCFVPRMVPEGAVHIPFPGTARICKKLGIDYAEAVTGFEFGSQMAVPVIEGVVVAVENKDLVKDAWRADNEEKRRKEARKAEAKILQTWRKFLFGLRIAERFREEYAGDQEGHLPDAHNPFASRRGMSQAQTQTPAGAATASGSASERPVGLVDEEEGDEMDRGGGFLLGGVDDADDGDLIVEERAPPARRVPNISHRDVSSDPEDESSADEYAEDEESPPPQKRRRTRNFKRA